MHGMDTELCQEYTESHSLSEGTAVSASILILHLVTLYSTIPQLKGHSGQNLNFSQ